MPGCYDCRSDPQNWDPVRTDGRRTHTAACQTHSESWTQTWPRTARHGPVYAPATVYASGLLNPRGLAFDSHGVLYVAEAGSGGKSRVTVAGYGYFDVGPTGRVSRITQAGQRET